MWPVNHLAARVVRARNLRGWSQRDAAVAGGISNQTWSRFEGSGHVTDLVHQAVMRAFNWPETWQQEAPEEPTGDVIDELRTRLEVTVSRLDDLQDQVDRMRERLAEVGRRTLSPDDDEQQPPGESRTAR